MCSKYRKIKERRECRKERRQGKKKPGQSSVHQQESKKFKGPQGFNQPTVQATGNKSILPIPSVASAQGGASKGQVILHCPHCGKKHKGECWKLTGACLGCGSKEHKVKDCPRARSFTAPQTGGNISSVQKGSKSVAALSLARQDGRAPARAYAMKAVEDNDAPM